MLEKVDLSNELSKADYKKRMPRLQERMRVLQQAAYEAGIATSIVLEGWDAAGKGTLVYRLLEKLDPRGFKVRPTYAPTVDELYRPWLWRFWMRLPARGEIVVFDRSWYGRVMVERIEKIIGMKEVQEAYLEINDFERALVDDGQVLVKLFLHISKKEQRKRFEKCESDPYQRWKIKPEDWRHHDQYRKYHRAIEEMLEKTSTAHAPWHVVEAEDRRWAEVEAFSTIVAGIEDRLKKLGKCPPADAVGLMKPKTAAPAARTAKGAASGDGKRRAGEARVGTR
jgi:polyphosphate kinase 2 (PPK2 family)